MSLVVTRWRAIVGAMDVRLTGSGTGGVGSAGQEAPGGTASQAGAKGEEGRKLIARLLAL
jgi:hypothetical protein